MSKRTVTPSDASGQAQADPETPSATDIRRRFVAATERACGLSVAMHILAEARIFHSLPDELAGRIDDAELQIAIALDEANRFVQENVDDLIGAAKS